MKMYKELPFVRWKNKNIIWDMKETQIPKQYRAENHERNEKNFSFEWIQTPKYGKPR